MTRPTFLIPQVVEDALWRAAREHASDMVVSPSRLVRFVEACSRRYTSERHLLAAPLVGAESREDLLARALFFTIADAAKIMLPLSELVAAGVMPTRQALRVLDLGAGAGAMTWGLSCFAPDQALTVRAVDRDRDALAILAAASAEFEGLSVETVVADVTDHIAHAQSSWDLIVAGSLLNELSEDAAYRVVAGMMSCLDVGGAVIVIEPALRETARRLHRVRDRVIGEGLAHVVAPCTRTLAPCPALEDPGDWCHEDRGVNLPSRTCGLARATGLRDSGLKFSYLVLTRERAELAPSQPGRKLLRVVSQPRKLKGKRECFACGETGRVRLRLLKRNRNVGNRVFERVQRGDVIIVPETVDSDIGSGDRVELVPQ